MAETKIDPKRDPSQEAAKAEKLSPEELAAQQKALAERMLQMAPHMLDQVLEQSSGRAQDQRQEQQLYASTWGGAAGVIAALVKITDAERDLSRRKALEVMQNEMFELLAKEKKRDALRSSPFFKQLVSILGHDTAESITQKLEAAGSTSANGLQANQAALTQAAKDIAVLLEKNQAVLGLRVSGETLATVLESEMKSAIALIPKPSPRLAVVKPEESLASNTHETMKGLERGEDRIGRLHNLRAELGPEKFTAMIDAYDRKYGIPLVAHIAHMSTSNPSVQAEMIGKAAGLLTPTQRERVTEYGRAEYAQTMALLDKQRESAQDNLRDVTTEIRATEKVLAANIGREELGYLPEGEVRGKILEELAKQLPELSGKNWQDVSLKLKDVAGQSDPASLNDALRALTGGKEVADPEALRDYIARATLHMQKLTALDQQVDAFHTILSTNETSDEAKLRNYYTQAYGTDATSRDGMYEALKSVADSHIDNLHRRIGDPALSTEERAVLIRERDSLEFSCVKKLAYDALHGTESPDAQAALTVLRNFVVSYADTQARRSEGFRGVCEQLITSIESADTLRREWQALDLAQFGNVELKKPTGRELVSCIDGRPARMDEMRLRERLAEVDAAHKSFSDSKDPLDRFIAKSAPTTKYSGIVSKETQLEVLKAQRQAALSTNFFAHILEDSVRYTPADAPLASVEIGSSSAQGATALERITAAASTSDTVGSKLRKELLSLEASPRNQFLSVPSQAALVSGLSKEICGKLESKTAAEAVSKVIRELDSARDIPVDREVLDAVRKVVPADSEIGRSFAVVQKGSSSPMREYEAIKSRLNPVDALRLDLLVARETDSVGQGKPSVAAGIVGEVLNLAPKDLLGAATEAREHARISRVERLLNRLTDEEHQEFLRFFEATTQRSVGQGLIATLPTEGTRQELLLRVAGSRCATSRDLQRFYGEPVPAGRADRVAALSRAFASDATRPVVKVDEVRQVAQGLAYQYANLRDATKVAMVQGDVALVGEIAEKMRGIESRLNGTITKTLTLQQVDASHAARSGIQEQLLALQEGILQGERSREVPGRPDMTELARDVAGLLRSAEPKTDAAFNRIRRANLTEEESLYLRALYVQETKRPSAHVDPRSVTGDLRRDLEPIARPNSEERERIAFVVRGGADALREADKRTLSIAERDRNEKRQLETLSNLRASGQYDQVKDQVAAMKLTPAAREYHNAVTSGDKTKADAADLAIKAKNGDVKPQEIASFLKDKNPEDLKRIKKDHPSLAKDLAAATSFLDEQQMSRLMSNIATERQWALQQAMLKSLANPSDFAAWLEVQGGRAQRQESIRNLEALLAKQPNARHFVAGGESPIIQFVRAQRTDFREIDAHLIKHIIATSLDQTRPLSDSTFGNLLTLREDAARRMSTLDAFEQPRRTIYNAAQENLSEKRRYLAEAQEDQNKRWFSAGKYDGVIALSKARIGEQEALLRPMERGIRDIESSRELVRYAFALMAKDTVAQVDRGLRPDVTDNVTTLLMQRDQAIQYKVTDQKRDVEWTAAVKSTSEAIQSFDKWATIGLGTAKVLTTVAAGIFLTPAAGLAVATAWNAGDKIYRGVVGKESIKSLAKSFAFELAIDTAFAALAAVKTTTITLAGGKAVEGTAAQGLKVSKRVWEWKPFQSALKPQSLQHADELLVHASEFQKAIGKATAKEANESIVEHTVIQKLGTKYFEKLAEKIPDAAIRSNWAQIHVGRFIRVPQAASLPSSEAKPAAKAEPKPDNAATKPTKLPEQGFQEGQPEKKPREEVAELMNPTRVPNAPTAPAPGTPSPAPSPIVQETVTINPGLLREIEEKLHVSPHADVQRAVDELRALMTQSPVSIIEGEEKLRELREAVGKWAPYPDLANALDKILSGSNPFSAFLNAPSSGYVSAPPPPPPTPPQAPPPPPPKAPDAPPGGGSGGMPGPALVVTPTMRGDSHSIPRRDGIADEQRVPVGDLSRASIEIASPRSELQGATMQEALVRASARPTEEARVLPQAQPTARPIASQSSLSLDDELLLTAQRAQVATALSNRLQMMEASKQSELSHLHSTPTPEVASSAEREKRADPTPEVASSAEREKRTDRRVEPVLGGEKEMHVSLKEAQSPQVTAAAKQSEGTRIAQIEAGREEATLKRSPNKGASSREQELEIAVAKKEAQTSPRRAETRAVDEQKSSTITIAGVESQAGEVRERQESALLAGTDRVRATPQQGAPGTIATSKETISGVAMRDEPRETERTTVAPSVAGATDGVSKPTSLDGRAVQPHSPQVTDPHRAANPLYGALTDEEGDNTIIERAIPSRGAAHKTKKRDASRMRHLLLQQLMDQHATKERRDKMLKALIALGISEVEYRKLLIKLGEMDAARLAEQVAASTKVAEPIALTVDAPAMKESAEPARPSREISRPEVKAQTTRAALYKRLREESIGARK